jgi:cell division protein FtsB
MPPVLSDVQKATKLSILLVKRDVLPPILEELNRKIQELEAKVDALQAQVETLKQTTKTN